MHLRGYFLEREYPTAKGHLFKLNTKKRIFLFKESIACHFVNFVEQKRGLFLSNANYVDILNYAQNNGIYDATSVRVSIHFPRQNIKTISRISRQIS